jgi:hypothetical protein
MAMIRAAPVSRLAGPVRQAWAEHPPGHPAGMAIALLIDPALGLWKLAIDNVHLGP